MSSRTCFQGAFLHLQNIQLVFESMVVWLCLNCRQWKEVSQITNQESHRHVVAKLSGTLGKLS